MDKAKWVEGLRVGGGGGWGGGKWWWWRQLYSNNNKNDFKRNGFKNRNNKNLKMVFKIKKKKNPIIWSFCLPTSSTASTS